MKQHMVILILAGLLALAGGVLGAADGSGTVDSFDGVPIHYYVQGSGAPALVFVHGWCCDAGYWRHQVPVFAQDHTVVTIDLAGHGASGMGRSEYTVEAYGEDVAAVVEALELDSVILIGHSMAGAVNLEAALRLPGRVRALVGVDTYQDFEMKFPPAQVEQFLTAFRNNFPVMARNYVKTLFPAGADSALVEAVVSDMAAAPPAVGIGTMQYALSYDPLKALNTLDLSVYCINSDRYPANEATGRRHTKSYSVMLIPGSGHFVMLEDPENFNILLAAAIDSIETQGE